MIRLHLSHPLVAEASLAPSEDQARYLLTVMRLRAGDPLLVFNGRDGEWRARVANVSKRQCSLTLEAQTRPQSAPPDLELVIAMVKRPRLETIIEKAVELGVSRIRLVVTQRTNHDRTNLPRLQAIAMEAAEQTGRLEVPEIVPPQTLASLIESWPTGRTLLYCDESGDDLGEPWGGATGRAGPALDRLQEQKAGPGSGRSGPQWAALVGPEGGFTPEERARLRSLDGVVVVSLGPRILRADTAAIAAIVLWQAVLGDWTKS